MNARSNGPVASNPRGRTSDGPATAVHRSWRARIRDALRGVTPERFNGLLPFPWIGMGVVAFFDREIYIGLLSVHAAMLFAIWAQLERLLDRPRASNRDGGTTT